MNELTTGQILDKILEYCLKNKDEFFNENKLIKVLLPEYVKDEMTVFFEKIKKQYPNVATVDIGTNNSSIQANGLTKKFLEQNGFSELEKTKNLEEQKSKDKEQLELDLAKSNLDANRLNKEVAGRNAKNEKSNIIATWINVAVGIINIGLFVWQALKD